MSLDTIDAKLAKAFDGPLARAVTAFAGSRFVPGEYDPVTGTSGTTITYAGRGVFGGYSIREVDDQHIMRTDVKLTALQNEVLLDADGSPATPAIDDEIDGARVVNVAKDPAGATWKIQLRRS